MAEVERLLRADDAKLRGSGNLRGLRGRVEDGYRLQRSRARVGQPRRELFGARRQLDPRADAGCPVDREHVVEPGRILGKSVDAVHEVQVGPALRHGGRDRPEALEPEPGGPADVAREPRDPERVDRALEAPYKFRSDEGNRGQVGRTIRPTEPPYRPSTATGAVQLNEHSSTRGRPAITLPHARPARHSAGFPTARSSTARTSGPLKTKIASRAPT